jgi:hypothetical protein
MTFRERQLEKSGDDITIGEFEQAGQMVAVKTKLAALLYILRQFHQGSITDTQLLGLGVDIEKSSLRENSGRGYEVVYC